VPLKVTERLPHDDFMSRGAASLWGSSGCRRDLAVMKAMGANAVRLYGNDVELDHTGFLDEAHREGLEVIAGLSDYPYIQMRGNCRTTNFDCYVQIREQYSQNLQRGFLTQDKAYHPALRMIILVNEPDLKFELQFGSDHFCKAVISALDGALDAELEAGVVGEKPVFTTTFSFGVCRKCTRFSDRPGLGQMEELRRCMRDPEAVGYKPRNDLWAAYKTRFVNGVNTANPAADFLRLFMGEYTAHFPDMPLFVGEYHSPNGDQTHQLAKMLEVANNESSPLLGISFFEFQVRYDKGGAEKSFGIFGLGDLGLGRVDIGEKSFPAWCLAPQADRISGELLVEAIWQAYGGAGLDYTKLCSGSCPAKEALPKAVLALSKGSEEEEEDPSSSSGFACGDGSEDWHEWSHAKRRWCCHHQALGCEGLEAAEAASSSSSSSSSASSQATSDEGQQPAAFDCDDGFERWRQTWTPLKQAWCCIRARRGCPSEGAEHAAAAGRTTAAPSAKLPPGMNKPYDCEEDFEDWQHRWSEGKKAWCCLYAEHKGCHSSGGRQDASAASPLTTATLSTTGAASAIPAAAAATTSSAAVSETIGGMATERPFDCQTGYATRDAEWSEKKKEWCCQQEGIACDASRVYGRRQQKLRRLL